MVRDTLNKIMAAVIVLGLIAGAAWSAPGRNVVANTGGSDTSAFPLQDDLLSARLTLHRTAPRAAPNVMFGCPAGGMCNMSAGLGCSNCSLGAYQDTDPIFGSFMIIAFERDHIQATGQSLTALLRPPRI